MGNVRSRRAAAFVVWYLRVVAFVNFLGAVWVSLEQDLRRHNTDDFFTPYLLTAGFATGVFTTFLAITLRRRKRAAWILNIVLGGLYLLLFLFAMVFAEIRQHAQNWVSTALTAAFVAALLVGRREFYAKGDRSNPRLAAGVAIGGLLLCSLLAALLVTVTNEADDAHRSTFWDRWGYGALRLISVAADDSDFVGITTPTWVNVIINVLSTLLVLAVLYAAFRSRRAVDPLSEDDEARLRALLDRHGDRDSLGYFALRREKSVVWSPTRKAGVTYRVRDREAENGLMEFMVIELLQRAGEIGITQVSLNFAMFRSVFERGGRLGAGPVLRLWRSLLGFFSRWWQIESLYRANAKYRPIWEPRFLLLEKSADLPRIAVASARAEGFLEAPGLPKWLHRRHLDSHR